MRRQTVGGSTACATVVLNWKACVGLSVAMRLDDPRGMLLWTPVLVRKKIGTAVLIMKA